MDQTLQMLHTHISDSRVIDEELLELCQSSQCLEAMISDTSPL